MNGLPDPMSMLPGLSALNPFNAFQAGMAATGAKNTMTPKDWIVLILGGLMVLIGVIFLALSSDTVQRGVSTAREVGKTVAVAAA